MVDAVLRVLRCPRCFAHPPLCVDSGVVCRSCHQRYPLVSGILDMSAGNAAEVITPFQRVMQNPIIATVYERVWRRLGYRLASFRSFDDELETIAKYCSGLGNGPVLDLACGPGVFTRPLARRSSGIVIGVDLSWPMLLRAQKRLSAERIGNSFFIRGSAFALPFIDRTFSLINCCGALHLFDRPENALAEIDRVCSPGAHLTVQTTIRPKHSAGLAFALERFIRFGFFEEGQLRACISAHNFDIRESERHRISFTFLARHIS